MPENANFNIISQIVGKVLVSLCGLLVINNVSRYLSVGEFGHYTLAFSIAALCQPLVEMGMNAIAIREMARDAKGAGGLLSGIILTRFVLTVATVLFVVTLMRLLGYDTRVQMLVFLACLGLFSVALGSSEVVFIIHGRVAVSVLSQLVSMAFLVLAVLAVIRFGLGSDGIVLCHVASGLIGAAVIFVWSGRFVRLQRPRLEQMKPFLGMVAPQALSSLITAAYYNIDSVLLSKIAGAEAVAYYGAAYRLLGFMTFVPYALMMVFFPFLARTFSESHERFRSTFGRLFGVFMFIAVVPAIWVKFYAVPILSFIYSPKYVTSGTVLKILVWAGLAVFASNVSGYGLVSANRQRLGVVISSTALVFNVGLNLVLIPRYGILGAAYATLFTEILVALIGFVLLAYFEKVHPFSGVLGWSLAAGAATWILGSSLENVDWRLSCVVFGLLFLSSSWILLSRTNRSFALS